MHSTSEKLVEGSALQIARDIDAQTDPHGIDRRLFPVG